MVNPPEPLSDEEAKLMLHRLALHFREPVMPVSQVCEKLTDWARVVAANTKAGLTELGRGWQVESVIMAIKKSSLLARTLYGGEKVRTTICPEHKGVWSGIQAPKDWGGPFCEHGCQLTGWIPEEK